MMDVKIDAFQVCCLDFPFDLQVTESRTVSMLGLVISKVEVKASPVYAEAHDSICVQSTSKLPFDLL